MFFIKKLKAHFAQGENNKRHEVLKAMVEAIRDEYTEDNYNSRISWLVEEILRSDPDFKFTIRCIKDKDMLKGAVADAVEKAWTVWKTVEERDK